MKKNIKEKEPETNVPFKLSVGFFKIETIIKPMSKGQLLLVIVISMIFILLIIRMLEQHAFAGISISGIFNKLSDMGISKVKSRSP